jgi:hypothetical protein
MRAQSESDLPNTLAAMLVEPPPGCCDFSHTPVFTLLSGKLSLWSCMHSGPTGDSQFLG